MKACCRYAVASLIALALTACSAPYFEPLEPADARIVVYIYRVKADNPGLQPLRFSYPEIFLDGQSVGLMKYKTRLMAEVSAGRHHIKVTGLSRDAAWDLKDINLDFISKPGEIRYFKLDVQYNLEEMQIGQPRPQYRVYLTPVDADEAVYEIRYTQPGS